MHSKINKIIEEWIGMEKDTCFPTFTHKEDTGYNDALQDLRTKAPQLTEIITNMVVEEIENQIVIENGINRDTKMPHYLEYNKGNTAGWNECREVIINLLKQ